MATVSGVEATKLWTSVAMGRQSEIASVVCMTLDDGKGSPFRAGIHRFDYYCCFNYIIYGCDLRWIDVIVDLIIIGKTLFDVSIFEELWL